MLDWTCRCGHPLSCHTSSSLKTILCAEHNNRRIELRGQCWIDHKSSGTGKVTDEKSTCNCQLARNLLAYPLKDDWYELARWYFDIFNNYNLDGEETFVHDLNRIATRRITKGVVFAGIYRNKQFKKSLVSSYRRTDLIIFEGNFNNEWVIVWSTPRQLAINEQIELKCMDQHGKPYNIPAKIKKINREDRIVVQVHEQEPAVRARHILGWIGYVNDGIFFEIHIDLYEQPLLRCHWNKFIGTPEEVLMCIPHERCFSDVSNILKQLR